MIFPCVTALYIVLGRIAKCEKVDLIGFINLGSAYIPISHKSINRFITSWWLSANSVTPLSLTYVTKFHSVTIDQLVAMQHPIGCTNFTPSLVKYFEWKDMNFYIMAFKATFLLWVKFESFSTSMLCILLWLQTNAKFNSSLCFKYMKDIRFVHCGELKIATVINNVVF